MPIYDFQCSKCEKVKENVLQKIEDKSPICCEKEMKRLVGGTTFMLTGGGWTGKTRVMD